LGLADLEKTATRRSVITPTFGIFNFYLNGILHSVEASTAVAICAPFTPHQQKKIMRRRLMTTILTKTVAEGNNNN
jgi:hypothetical protein